MAISYMSQLLGWVNVFISLFIILFAFSFFKKTEPHENRRPWMFLFVSVIIFFLIELTGVIPSTANLMDLRNFLKTIFIAVILYVFVFQYSLLTKTGKIVINKKEAAPKSVLPNTQTSEQITKDIPKSAKRK
jgi:hypothetical protein